MNFARRLGVWLSQGLNVLRGGLPDETTSAWAYREHLKGRTWPRLIINTIFFWEMDHCKAAHLAEMAREHSPKEYH